MKMAAIIKVLAIVLFLGLITNGSSKSCTLRDLSVSQSKTGATVQGKPEWAVTISNKCACAQSSVTLNCRGFNTVESIDPDILKVSGDTCLVDFGGAIGLGDPVKFKYAWDTSFPLTPISSVIACS